MTISDVLNKSKKKIYDYFFFAEQEQMLVQT